MTIIENNNDADAAALRVERAIFELRRGRTIEVRDGARRSVVAAVETVDPTTLARFAGCAGMLRLALTAERAEALGLAALGSAVEIELPADTSAERVSRLASLGPHTAPGLSDLRLTGTAHSTREGALAIARHARLIPALVWHDASGFAPEVCRLEVSVADIGHYPQVRGRELQRVSRAQVPLASHERCEFIAYRERFGDAEHVAIIIGTPQTDRPVLVRMHSSCLTGDLLDSLRCDCGDQLRGAVERIAAAGGGVLLYLAQEGRGIGLANKLRAYALQDGGLDTIEANHHLGFRSDERDYTAACSMLKDLGIGRVRLLTNNPGKITALGCCDIEVVDRAPLPAAVTPHNARYLRTKRDRAGHLESRAEGPEAD